MLSSTDGWAVVSPTPRFDNVNESIIRWDGTKWSNVTTQAYFESLDMVSSNDGWAVGPSGTIFRWDGTKWSRVENPTNYPLESVDMVSSTDGWAVGRRAVIMRWNGTSWSLARGEVAGAWLWSVDMVSSSDGWAVGSGGDIMRWDGISWEYVTSPTTKHLFSVDMVNSTDGWAVGSDGCIIHWDGASWSNVTSPTTAWLSCVDMVSSTDGWIVGADGIYRWQEEVAGFPTDYLIIIIAVIVVVVVVVWFFIRNRQAHTRTERVVPAVKVQEKKGNASDIFTWSWVQIPPPAVFTTYLVDVRGVFTLTYLSLRGC
jgi:hypothetical protein